MAPLILSMDTAGDACAVAVAQGTNVLAAKSAPMTRGHAEALFPMIADTLDAAGLSAAALDAVAVCVGPGGFAGVRVGVAAARGLALGLGRPAVGVDWFAVLAADARGPTTVTLPARRGAVHRRRFVDGAPIGAVETLAAPEESELAAEAQRWEARRRDAGPAALAVAAAGLLAGGTVPPRPAPLYLRPPDAVAPAPSLAARAL